MITKETVLLTVLAFWMLLGYFVGRRRGLKIVGTLAGFLGPLGVGLLRLRRPSAAFPAEDSESA